jgi:lipid-A-disaccharide synthase
MTDKPLSLFIFAGEQSGDLHGSHLMKALKSRNPHLHVFGVGGPAMRAQGLSTILNMEDFEVMGFTDVILALPRLYRMFYLILNTLMQRLPSMILLIDYPGFNLRLAKALRKRGFQGKIVQYVCPSVWAHGKKRIKQMTENLDLLLATLPFEPSYFEGSNLQAVYVGNPLQEYIKCYQYQENWKIKLGIPPEDPLIALFPGSRQGEVLRNLPFILQAVEKLKKENKNVRFGISCAHPLTSVFANKALQESSLIINKDIFYVPKNYTYELMRDSRAAVAKSGTVTLELALHQCPTVVVYKLTRLNHFIAKWILRLKLKHYSLANILANESVFPELIEYGFSINNIYLHLKLMFNETLERKACLEGCKRINVLLKENKASQAGAMKLEELLLC